MGELNNISTFENVGMVRGHLRDRYDEFFIWCSHEGQETHINVSLQVLSGLHLNIGNVCD